MRIERIVRAVAARVLVSPLSFTALSLEKSLAMPLIARSVVPTGRPERGRRQLFCGERLQRGLFGMPRKRTRRIQNFGHYHVSMVGIQRFRPTAGDSQFTMPWVISRAFQVKVGTIVLNELAANSRCEFLERIESSGGRQHFDHPVIFHNRVADDALAIQRPTVAAHNRDVDRVERVAADKPSPIVARPHRSSDAANSVGVVNAFERRLFDMAP